MNRCPWCGTDPLYVAYHDTEWGVPVHDDRKHFEFLVLESAQAGLSWLTVLRKRENYRAAYDGFDPWKVAAYDEAKIQALLADPGLIRNRKKIEASVTNARCFLEIQAAFGSFDRYIWQFTDGKPLVNQWEQLSQLPAKTALSDAVAKDMKARGFRFLGTTILYAHLQAIGVINDHLTGCFRHREVQGLETAESQ